MKKCHWRPATFMLKNFGRCPMRIRLRCLKMPRTCHYSQVDSNMGSNYNRDPSKGGVPDFDRNHLLCVCASLSHTTIPEASPKALGCLEIAFGAPLAIAREAASPGPWRQLVLFLRRPFSKNGKYFLTTPRAPDF